MYGMVNQAIKDLVVTQFGQDRWLKISEKANVPAEDFVFMHYYPDKITYDLVGAASQELSLPAEVILKEFGKYWVLYTAKEGYGALMDLFGADFKGCLKNLNNLHARMGMTMPNLTPPRFVFVEKQPDLYVISYFSKRPGLCPMVVGLLEGLAAKYSVKIEINLLKRPEGATSQDIEIRLVG